MCRFMFLLLFIFAPGNTQLNVSPGCGSNYLAARERSGSIRYSLPPIHYNIPLVNQITENTESPLDFTCTWIIDAHENQTVWIDVLSVGRGASLGIRFGNEDRLVYDREQRALFTGTGRTSIEWSWRWSVKTSGALHIRWNTSEDSHVFALIPYTHSETDAVSPSPSGSSSVTYTPDIPGRGNVALNTQALRGQNVWQGGGVSDLADKNRPLYPQENTNNGEETAGAWISDLTHAGTDSYDTHTGRDTDSAANTHINTHSVFSHEPSLARSSTKIQSPSLSIHTTPRHSTDATAKTNTLSLLETNDVTRTEFDTLNTGNSYYRNTDTLTDILSGTLKVKRDDSISSTLPTFSLFSVSPHNRDTNQKPFDVTTEQKDIFSVSPVEVHHQSVYNRDVSTISENVRTDQFDVKTLAITHENRPVESETNRVERSPRSTHPNLNITDQSYSASYDDLIISSTPAAVSEFPDFNQSNPVDFSGSKTIKYSSGSSDSTSGITQRPINVTVLSTENELTSSSETEDMLSTKQLTNDTHESYTTQPSTSLKPSTIHNSHTIQNQHNTSTQQTSSASPPSSSDISGLNTSSPFNSTDISDLNTSHDTNEVSTFIPFTAFTLPDQTSAQSSGTPEGDMNPSPYRSDCLNVTCISYLPTTARQDEERQESLITSPPSISSSGSTGPQINPDVTSDLMNESITTVRSENQTDFKESETSPSEIQKTHSHTNSPAETQPNTRAESEPPVDTPTPEFSSSPPHTTEDNVGFSAVTNITHTSYSGQTVDVDYSSPTQSSVTASSKTSLSLSPFNHIQTGSTENTDSTTAHNAETAGTDSTSPDITAPHISLSSSVSMIDHAAHTRTPVSMTTPHWDTSQTSTTPAITTPQSKLTRTTTKHLSLTSIEDPLVYLQTHVPMLQSSTTRPLQHTSTQPYLTPAKTHTISTQAVNQTSWVPPTSSRSDRDWPHRKHFFIVEDQPVIIKEKTFQILLQIVLEENFVPGMRLLEMEPFLRNISGYQSQHVTWHNGPVLQTVVLFQTAETFSWLGRMEFLLQEAGLNPLPKKGLFVGGVRVKNITVGGLQTDVCEWLFECPSGFQCDSSKGNASCKSVCHSDYCKHHGICVHRSGHQPLCQCPVGEDYWFMGPRCDLRMTRPRLVGVCFGVLAAVAAVMALLSYLAVRRFKSMLIQAKVDQTRSSYRKFNHFDELSARFWGRSWPGSEDSLDNPAFTRSDELLHLRALDRTCCYHDDSLSVVSTYHGSGTHLNTIYPHSSQYGWDLSNCSLADGVVDSGKASDLSVCSWPIEPIQWTPFPLLQQITRNTNTVKVSRPRSYCEGMELVDLEKSWTA